MSSLALFPCVSTISELAAVPEKEMTPTTQTKNRKTKMSTSKTTSYNISIFADNVWAGSGIFDQTDNGQTIVGNIRDCGAELGSGGQEKAEAIYEAIEDAIDDMDSPEAGQIEVDAVTYSWTLERR